MESDICRKDGSYLEVTEVVEVIAQCTLIGTRRFGEWTLRSTRYSGSSDGIARDDTSLDVELVVRETRDRIVISIVEDPDSSTPASRIERPF